MAAKKKTVFAKIQTKASKTAKAKAPPKTTKAKTAKAKAPPKTTKAKTAKAKVPPKTTKAAPSKTAKPIKPAKPVPPESAIAALDAGQRAPRFDLSDEQGARVSSGALAGKPYLLYFYPKDDTPGCTKEACDIRDNFGRFGKLGLRALGVSPDSQQSHAKFGKKYGLPFTLLSDPDKTLAIAYGVWGLKSNYGKQYMGIIRSSFLIGADGLIKKAYRGVRVGGHVAAVLEDAKALL